MDASARQSRASVASLATSRCQPNASVASLDVSPAPTEGFDWQSDRPFAGFSRRRAACNSPRSRSPFVRCPRSLSRSLAARVDALAAHRAVRAAAALGAHFAGEAADAHGVADGGRSIDHLALGEGARGAARDAADAVDADRVGRARVGRAERNRSTIIDTARALVAEAARSALAVHRAALRALARRAHLSFGATTAVTAHRVAAHACGARLARGARNRHRASRDATPVDALLSRSALEVELAHLLGRAATTVDAALAHRARDVAAASATRFAATRRGVAHEARAEGRAVGVARAARDTCVARVAVLARRAHRGARASRRRGNALADRAIAHEACLALRIGGTAHRHGRIGIVAATVARRSRAGSPHGAPRQHKRERTEKRELRDRGELGHIELPPERGREASSLRAGAMTIPDGRQNPANRAAVLRVGAGDQWRVLLPRVNVDSRFAVNDPLGRPFGCAVQRSGTSEDREGVVYSPGSTVVCDPLKQRFAHERSGRRRVGAERGPLERCAGCADRDESASSGASFGAAAVDATRPRPSVSPVERSSPQRHPRRPAQQRRASRVGR